MGLDNNVSPVGAENNVSEKLDRITAMRSGDAPLAHPADTTPHDAPTDTPTQPAPFQSSTQHFIPLIFSVLFHAIPTLLNLILPLNLVKKLKLQFTRIPLGLASSSRKPHSFLQLSSLPTSTDSATVLERYISSLPRSQKATIKNQVAKSLARNNIRITSTSNTTLTLEHFRVLHSHELQHFSPVKAVLISTLRFFSARFMVGSVDNYYSSDGILVAWSSVTIAGNTLRAMWFYQDPASRSNIYFDCMRSSLARSELLNLDNVDLGPATLATKATKEKFGFVTTPEWRSWVTGEVTDDVNVPPYQALTF